MSRLVAAALLIVLSCTACIRSATVIKVKADGSGTVEQTVLMNAGFMKGMLGGFGAPQGQAPAQGMALPSADEMKQAASQMGEGVTFVSSTPVKDPDGFEGSTSIFAFTDIRKIRVDQDPNLRASSTGGLSTPPKSDSPVTFDFTRAGEASTLTITMRDKPKSGATPPAGGPDMSSPQMLEMMKTMFRGFKVGIDVEVAGKILKTNADHVAGSRVTLLEMEMEKLLQDESKLAQVQKMLGPDASVAELKPYLKDVKGLKVNDPVVTIQFR